MGFNSSVEGREVVYIQKSSSGKLAVKVYSSCAVGDRVARGCGDDAIRVVLRGVSGKSQDGGHPRLDPAQVQEDLENRLRQGCSRSDR